MPNKFLTSSALSENPVRHTNALKALFYTNPTMSTAHLANGSAVTSTEESINWSKRPTLILTNHNIIRNVKHQ